MQSVKLRNFSVSATYDIISSALIYMMKPKIPPDSIHFLPSETLPDHLSLRATVSLSDEILFNWIFPSFETVFSPRQYHRNKLVERVLGNEASKEFSITKFSRGDLLSSLKVVSTVGYEDVRNEILNGLLQMLQNDGNLFHGSWGAVVEIITIVPASLEPHSNIFDSISGQRLESTGDSRFNSDGSQEVHTDDAIPLRWSRLSLSIAFNCIKLIVSESFFAFRAILYLTVYL